MNKDLNIKNKPGELFGIEILNEKEEEITTIYDEEINTSMLDIIQLLSKRGYIIKITYHYNKNKN